MLSIGLFKIKLKPRPPRAIRLFKNKNDEYLAMVNTPPGTCYRCGLEFRTHHARNMCTHCLRDIFGVDFFDWAMAIFTFQSPYEEVPTTWQGHARGVAGIMFWVTLLAVAITFARGYHG